MYGKGIFTRFKAQSFATNQVQNVCEPVYTWFENAFQWSELGKLIINRLNVNQQ